MSYVSQKCAHTYTVVWVLRFPVKVKSRFPVLCFRGAIHRDLMGTDWTLWVLAECGLGVTRFEERNGPEALCKRKGIPLAGALLWLQHPSLLYFSKMEASGCLCQLSITLLKTLGESQAAVSTAAEKCGFCLRCEFHTPSVKTGFVNLFLEKSPLSLFLTSQSRPEQIARLSYRKASWETTAASDCWIRWFIQQIFVENDSVQKQAQQVSENRKIWLVS